MTTLIIQISNDKTANVLREELERRSDIQSVQLKIQPPTAVIDKITRASESSLAESWLSSEDDHWDDYYQQVCTEKEI